MTNFAYDDSNSFQILRNPLAELFQALHDGPDYSTQLLKTQLAVLLRSKKVGGLNHIGWHFYISKVFARNHGSPELLQNHGFEWIEHGNSHQYWKLDGAENHQLLSAIVEEITRSPIIT